jgi:hypothetical protein
MRDRKERRNVERNETKERNEENVSFKNLDLLHGNVLKIWEYSF